MRSEDLHATSAALGADMSFRTEGAPSSRLERKKKAITEQSTAALRLLGRYPRTPGEDGRKPGRFATITELTRILLDYWQIGERMHVFRIRDLLGLKTTRRVYDITNVLIGADILMKQERQMYIRLK